MREAAPIAWAHVAPPAARLVSLGTTGLRMSRIGLGLAGLGRPAYMARGRNRDLGADRSVHAMRHRCYALLDAARSAGVTYVDAARSYGLAEQFVNTWWDDRHLPDSALTVGSKWGYTYAACWRRDAQVHEVKRLSLETLRRMPDEESEESVVEELRPAEPRERARMSG